MPSVVAKGEPLATSQQQPPAFIEIVQTTEKVTDSFSRGTNALQAISASEAFRKYDWLAKAPGLNSAGNLRGMVISARWHTVFQVSCEFADAFEHLAFVAGVAVNILHSSAEIEAIFNSDDSWNIKGPGLCFHVTSLATRTVFGSIPAGFSLLAMSLQGYCQLGSQATGGRFQPESCIANLKTADTYVTTTFNNITDGNNIYGFLNATISSGVNRFMNR